MMRCSTGGVLAFLGSMAAANAAHAGSFRLLYPAPPAPCPSEEAFHLIVAKYNAGEDLFDPNGTGVVRVSLGKISGGFRARVVQLGEDGELIDEHQVDAVECRAAVEEVAAVTGLMILPPLAPSAPPPLPPPAPPPAPPCPPPEPRRLPSLLDPRTIQPFLEEAPSFTQPPPPVWVPPVDVSLAFSLGPLLALGYFADVAPGAYLGVEIENPFFSFGVELRGLLPVSVEVKDPIDPSKPTFPNSIDVSSMTALMVPCFHYRYFFGCGVANVGLTFADAPGGPAPPLTYVGLGPRLGAEIPFSGDRFGIRFFGEALFNPLAGGRFQNTTPTNVFRAQGLASGNFGLAFVYRIR